MNTTMQTQKSGTNKSLFLFITAFATYCFTVITLSATGIFTLINTNIFPAIVALATICLTLSYFLIPSVQAIAQKLGPYGLASFHVWRIPAALTFLYYGYQGLLPMTFVNLAGWGDMLAGVLAIVIFLLPRSAKTVTSFHLIGFADFIIAVGTGIILNYIDPTSMKNILLLPVAIIPLVGVPLSGATHIAALHMIKTKTYTYQ